MSRPKKTDKERIEEHERHMKQQDAERRDLKETMIRMGELLDKYDDKLENHEKRIDAIEQKPGRRWEMVIDKIITVLVAGFVAYIVPTLK